MGIAPEVLKACLGYARGSDAVAVSIGYTPESNNVLGKRAQAVFVHTSLRDTSVGADLILADRLPWSLADERLPNQVANPVRDRMKPLLDQTRKEFENAPPVDRFLAHLKEVGLSVEGQTKAQLLEKLRQTGDDPQTLLDLMFKSVATADGSTEARVAEFNALAGKFNFRVSADTVKGVTDLLKSLRPDKKDALVQLVWIGFDGESHVSWSLAERTFLVIGSFSTPKANDHDAALAVLQLLQAKQLSLLTLRVRYVRGDITADSKCLTLSDDAKVSEKASEAATSVLRSVEQAYPWIAAARRHAALIALLRWALQPANVDFVDFAELATVDVHRVITPDYVCRDELQACSVR